MDENLINAYGYSNLQRAVLTNLLAGLLGKETKVAKELQGFYNDVRSDLQVAEFPPGSLKVEEVRQRSLKLAAEFFRDVEGVLLRSETLSEPGLRVL